MKGVIFIYVAKIQLNNRTFKGTLDFYTIIKVLEDLKEYGFEFTVIDIFKEISDLDNLNMYVVASLLLNSIMRYEEISEEVITENFIESVKDPKGFVDIFTYITTLFNKCMPDSTKKSETLEFEFEDEGEDPKEDWDFDYMEYLWYSIIKRTDDFYRVTPRNFFKQLDIYKDVNNIKPKDDEKVEYL